MNTEALKQQAHKEFNERIEKFKYDFLNHKGIHSKEYMIDLYLKILKEGFIDSLIDKTVQMTEERTVDILREMQDKYLDINSYEIYVELEDIIKHLNK